MSSEQRESAYRAAGVDIDAQERALGRIKKLVESTHNKSVLSAEGSFGGLFQPDLSNFDEPVLVASADGVGTKLMVARMVGDFSTVGRDLVNHCVNDILVQGAVPIFFLDYVGAGLLDPDAMVQLVRGVADGCKENGCALLGGETAEMPGFYEPGDYELVGFIVGVVDGSKILEKKRVRAGDLLLGLPSSGLHTNGYSLARKVFFEKLGLDVGDRVPGVRSKKKLGQVLLTPHRSYRQALEPLLGHPALHAVAHITGGGVTENLPRILPPKTRAEIRLGSWDIPEVFHVIQEHGGVASDEMLRVFNMGVGMVLAVEPEEAGEVFKILKKNGEKAFPMGTVQQGGSGVVYDFGVAEEAVP